MTKGRLKRPFLVFILEAKKGDLRGRQKECFFYHAFFDLPPFFMYI